MPPRSSKGKAPVVPVTKGKKNAVPESDDEEHDVRVQEELLIRSAANVGKGTSSDRHLDPDVSYDTDILVPDKATPERFSFTERSSKKAPAETPKKKKKRSFHDLQGFGDLKDSSANKIQVLRQEKGKGRPCAHRCRGAPAGSQDRAAYG